VDLTTQLDREKIYQAGDTEIITAEMLHFSNLYKPLANLLNHVKLAHDTHAALIETQATQKNAQKT
jgi:hypothetical protein